MIAYSIKCILCSGILIALYFLLLQSEKTYQFNRFFLLLILPLSIITPLITFELDNHNLTPNLSYLYASQQITQAEAIIDASAIESIEPSTFSWLKFLMGCYWCISAILFIRYCRGLQRMVSNIRSHAHKHINNITLIVMDQPMIPHTFLHYVFISRVDAENKQILTHEFTHAKQKHSWDILFMEFLQCFMWVNPFLFLIKKIIRLNHEFIADEAVITYHPETAEYQQLLLSKVGSIEQSPFASSFSYSLTKKRFIMMTAIKNQKRSITKMIIVLSVIPALVFVFAEKGYSQVENQTPTITMLDNTATPAMVTEFEKLVSKYNVTNKSQDSKHIALDATNMTIEDRKRIQRIYSVMSEQQKAKYPKEIILVAVPSPTPAKKTPTPEELISWKDSKTYGVWLDGEKISNEDLNKINSSDVSFYTVSRLLGNAAKNVSYKFQVDLMTKGYYEKTYQKSN